jgi:formylmethanofuran dehydrogenase subunit C
VAGSAGEFAGMSLIAGTILVLGSLGARAGAGMRRGTVAVGGGPPALLPSFRHDCDYRPTFLTPYLRQARAWGLPVPGPLLHGTWRRFSGDLLALGKGEVLHYIGP